MAWTRLDHSRTASLFFLDVPRVYDFRVLRDKLWEKVGKSEGIWLYVNNLHGIIRRTCFVFSLLFFFFLFRFKIALDLNEFGYYKLLGKISRRGEKWRLKMIFYLITWKIRVVIRFVDTSDLIYIPIELIYMKFIFQVLKIELVRLVLSIKA